MPVYRAIRIHMPDRPGALSAISSALAAHQVDIVRLDVVSHDDSTVVDDLVLAAVSQDDIGRAIGGFYPEVSVRTFDEVSGDPSLEIAAGLRAVASASEITSAREALLRGAIRVSRADNALLLSVTPAGGLEGVAVSGPVPPITAGEPFRRALGHRARRGGGVSGSRRLGADALPAHPFSLLGGDGPHGRRCPIAGLEAAEHTVLSGRTRTAGSLR